MDVKPGVKTTEFWLTLIVNALLLALPVLAGKMGDPQTTGVAVLSALVAGLTTAAYTLQRYLAKRGAQKATIATGEAQTAQARIESGTVANIQAIVTRLLSAANQNGQPKP